MPCGDSRSADEKSPVNQRIPPMQGKKWMCISGYGEIDLPRGIGCEEAERYSLVKGYVFAKAMILIIET